MPEGGDVEVGVAVVVVVAGCRTHVPAASREPRALRDISEAQRVTGAAGRGPELVAKQPARGARAGRPLWKEHVEIAVAVVIEQGHAGADDLGQPEVAHRAGLVHERQPHLLCDLAKPRLGGARNRSAASHEQPGGAEAENGRRDDEPARQIHRVCFMRSRSR